MGEEAPLASTHHTPSRQYESEDEKVLNGPKVVQFLRTIVEMKKERKNLVDKVAELMLELMSL